MNEVMDSTNGLKTAVEDAHDPAKSPPRVLDGEQMPLLPLRNAEEGEVAQAREVSARRGAGRPLGSKNKSTKQWTDYILSRYSAPLEALAAMYSRPLPDLLDEIMEITGALKGTKPTFDQVLAVLKIQMGAAKELAPYMHQKQPMAIQGGDGGLVNLFIGDVKAAEVHTDEADDFELEIIDIESEENQEVSDREKQNSNVCGSNVLDQGAENKKESEDSTTD